MKIARIYGKSEKYHGNPAATHPPSISITKNRSKQARFAGLRADYIHTPSHREGNAVETGSSQNQKQPMFHTLNQNR